MKYKTIIKNCETLDDKAQRIYRCKSKRVKKFILECERYKYYRTLQFHEILIKNGFPIDNLELKLPEYIGESELPSHITSKFIKTLKKYFSNKVILRMFREHKYNFNSLVIKDLVNQLYQVDQNKELSNQLKKKKIRDFNWLERHLSRLVLYIKKEDFSLDQKDYVLKLDNYKYKLKDKEIKILVPKTKHDLIKCSELFDFCIGTEDFYGEQIRKGELSFIAVFENNKPSQGVLFTDKRIIQAYNKGNESASFDIKHSIRELLFKTKKIEANSSWISHFEYSDEILTMVTKKGDEYQYVIGENIVNELENSPSRGQYYSRHIKGNYQSPKQVA